VSAPLLQAFHQVVGKNAPAPGQSVPVYCSIASSATPGQQSFTCTLIPAIALTGSPPPNAEVGEFTGVGVNLQATLAAFGVVASPGIAQGQAGVAGGGVYDPDVRDALIMAWTSFQRAGGTSLPGGAGGDTLISPVSL
jgi:hypothetical protein